MKFNAIVSPLVIASLLTVSSFCLAKEEMPETTIEGLQLVKNTNLAMVYAEPGIDLGQYNRIFLADAYIAFKKNWQRNKNRTNSSRISANDMAKMKNNLSLLFMDVFSTTLEEGGYELVTERAEDVLLIKPAIINLDVIAPDSSAAGIERTFAESAGEMTLYLELYDSLSDDLIAKAMDRREDRQTGYIRWQNRITNRAAAKRILQVWANTLKEGLDEARSSSGTQ
jgi:hypothetical protein